MAYSIRPERCPSWLKERDWKSRNGGFLVRGFESRPLRSVPRLYRPGVTSALLDRVGVLRPLRHRDFRLLWTGTAASLIGDGFFIVALAWEVYSLGGSPAALGAAGVAWTLPLALLIAPGGVLADRVDRRYPMIAGDLLRGVAVAAMAALALTGAITVAWIVGLLLLFGAGDAIYIPAFEAITPALVPEADLVQANSLSQVITPVARTLAGPFVGGLVIAAAGVGTAFAVDAASFGVSAVMVALVGHRHAREGEPESVLDDFREGVAVVRRARWLWVGLVSTGLAILCTLGAWDVLIPFLVKNDLHSSAATLGLVVAAGGVGAGVAAILHGQRARLPRRALTVYYLAFAMSNAAMAAFGLVLHVWQAALVAVVVQAASTTESIYWLTIEYRLVPEQMLGRVVSLDWMIALAGVPLSYAVIGPVANLIGAREALVVSGLAGAVVMLVPIVIPGALSPEADGSLAEADQAGRTRGSSQA
jgi:MFS family permease